ncbi:hypothetical protein BY996DRAFT_6447458 [Phakopsora pachyrhizi]|nr:hypothetical protein BY996DRAFT_6447458 [Phakopsora pachyrhizi]
MFGSVLPNPNCVPGSMFHSPLPTIGPPDISNDKLLCQTGEEGSEHLQQRGYYGRNPSLSQPGNSYGDGFHQQQREFGDGPRVISNHYSGGFQLFRARMGPNQNSLGRGGMGLSKNFYGANHLNQQYPQTSYNNNSYPEEVMGAMAMATLTKILTTNWLTIPELQITETIMLRVIPLVLQICTLTIHLRQEVVVMVERVLGIVV